MRNNFIYTNEDSFERNGKKISLKGIGIGNYLMLEYFMIGLHGTDSQIKDIIISLYGPEKAARFWDTYYQTFLNEEDFKFFKQIGINTIRLAFNHSIFISRDNLFEFNNEGFKYIDRVLQFCEKYEIYAVLDLHSTPGGQNSEFHSDNSFGESLFWEYGSFKESMIFLWENIAEYYKDNPWVAGYDILNEPTIEQSRIQELDILYHKTVKAIRKIDKNHIIFLEGNMYSSEFCGLTPIEEKNIAYSFHNYPFMHFINYEDKQYEEFDYDEFRVEYNKKFVENETFKYIRETLKGPIWCGETGIPHSKNTIYNTFNFKTLDIMISTFNKNNISWSLWTYKDIGKLAIVSLKENSKWLKMINKFNTDNDFIKKLQNLLNEYTELDSSYSFPLPEELKVKMKYKKLAEKETILNYKTKLALSEISFENIISYIESFKLSECEINMNIAEIVKKHI